VGPLRTPRIDSVGDAFATEDMGRAPRLTDVLPSALPRGEDHALRLGAAHHVEEHRLERSHASGGLSDEEQARLREVEVALDQCWDLLRQREALRNSGGDPASASIRPAGEVEGYLG